MPAPLRIVALEPYEALSHRLFLDGLQRHSAHHIEVHTLPAHGWKWRMRLSAIHFARLLEGAEPWDLLLVSDYLNLAELLALLPEHLRRAPAAVYFHENQLTYPLQGDERRDHHFGLVHLYALLASRGALFNSDYHRQSFFAALTELLRLAPDPQPTDLVPALAARAGVLPLGTELAAGAPRPPRDGVPVLLWNHRWEYDKNPAALVEALGELRRRGVAFRLRVLGQRFRRVPPEFEDLSRLLGEDLLEAGFRPGREAYLEALGGSDLAVSTALHEFFGLGTLEALRSGLLPVLPDDLAYPELLPPEERVAGRFLYSRSEPLADALERAIEAWRGADWMGPRRRLVEYTERFTWTQLAPRFDAHFEQLVGTDAAGAPG